MQRYDSILFMGAGDRSGARCFDLVSRLIDAFERLGGMQQPPRWEKEPTLRMLDEETKYIIDSEIIIELLVRDIAMALTGKKIKFEENK